MSTSTTTYRHPGSTTTPDTVSTVVYRHTTMTAAYVAVGPMPAPGVGYVRSFLDSIAR